VHLTIYARKSENERPKDRPIHVRKHGAFATSAGGGPSYPATVSLRFELEEEAKWGHPVVWISNMSADEAAELGSMLLNAADRARALARGEK